ncbi:MAG: NYN domain-containing protein [Gemmataceae bacterium]|nr:NYN domain-containing protein [Gemmataceae bacterium]
MLTNFYIDAFNLYYGCLKNGPHKWLNLVEFCRLSFPPPTNQLHRVRYFTALVKPYPSDPQQPVRQQTLLRALRTLPELAIHLGQYRKSKTYLKLVSPPSGGPDTAHVWKSEEKGSDVNLATHLLLDAFQNDCEAAVVVSNDSDLCEPIRVVRQVLRKPVVVLFPVLPGRHGSNDLKKVASRHETIDPAHLAAAQFPPQLTDANGTIHKPATW